MRHLSSVRNNDGILCIDHTALLESSQVSLNGDFLLQNDAENRIRSVVLRAREMEVDFSLKTDNPTPSFT